MIDIDRELEEGFGLEKVAVSRVAWKLIYKPMLEAAVKKGGPTAKAAEKALKTRKVPREFMQTAQQEAKQLHMAQMGESMAQSPKLMKELRGKGGVEGLEEMAKRAPGRDTKHFTMHSDPAKVLKQRKGTSPVFVEKILPEAGAESRTMLRELPGQRLFGIERGGHSGQRVYKRELQKALSPESKAYSAQVADIFKKQRTQFMGDLSRRAAKAGEGRASEASAAARAATGKGGTAEVSRKAADRAARKARAQARIKAQAKTQEAGTQAQRQATQATEAAEAVPLRTPAAAPAAPKPAPAATPAAAPAPAPATAPAATPAAAPSPPSVLTSAPTPSTSAGWGAPEYIGAAGLGALGAGAIGVPTALALRNRAQQKQQMATPKVASVRDELLDRLINLVV